MAVIVKKNKAPKLSSGYFQTSYELLETIATKTQSFNVLASYLAIARHGNGLDPDEPFRYSGSGLKSITDYTKVGEISARLSLDALLEHGYIHALPKEQVKPNKRYMLTHVDLDLCLPWALINDTWSPSKTTIDSALTRLQKRVSDDKTKLDALMILLNCYRTDTLKMLDKGGIDPSTSVLRKWTRRVIPKGGNQEWQLEPESVNESAYPDFMRQCLRYRIPSKQKQLTDSDKHDFWNAWGKLNELGLVYEAVTLFNGKQALMTLRVSDYHADKAQVAIADTPDTLDSIRVENGLPIPVRGTKGKAGKEGKGADPSYMRALNNHSGTEHQFCETEYTPNSSLDEGQIKIRVTLPSSCGSDTHTVIGVYRPRFRPSTDDLGQWNDREQANIKATLG